MQTDMRMETNEKKPFKAIIGTSQMVSWKIVI